MESSIYGTLIARDFTYAAIVLYPPKGANQIDLFYQIKQAVESANVEAMGVFKKLAWTLETDVYPADEALLVGGWIMARGLIDTTLTVDMFTLITLGLVGSFALLWLVTGSLRQSGIAVAVVIGGNIAWTWGQIGVIDLFWPMQMRVYILLAFANAILQGLSFSLVFLTVYNRIRRVGTLSQASAWTEARSRQIKPLGLIAAISFFGFVTLITSFKVVAIRELAMMSAVGVLNLVFLAFMVLPAMHALVGGEGSETGRTPRLERVYVALGRMCGKVTVRTPAWFVVCMLITLSAVTTAELVRGKLEIGTKPIEFVRGTAIDRTADFLNAPDRTGFDAMDIYVENRDGSMIDVAFAQDVQRFAADVRAIEEVRRVWSIYDEVPPLSQGLFETPFPQTDGQLSFLFQGAIGLNETAVRDQLYDQSGVRLSAFMAMEDMRELLETCQKVRDKAAQYPRIRIAIMGDICQYPQTDEEIVAGKPVNAGQGQLVVIFFAMLFVFFSLKISRRVHRCSVSVKTGIVMGVPFAFATCAIFFVMMQFGIPLNVATASISALAINATTDFTIHFVHSYMWFRERGYRHAGALLRAYKDKGTVVCGDMVQNALCFSILTVSTFQPVAMLGLLMTVMVIFAGIGTLLIMPPFLRWAYR